MTRLCLIRHGETDWNAAGRIQGQIDIPLSSIGHAQARAVANALRHEDLVALYTSDLLRARQTAEATAHLIHQPLIVEPGLRERHYGVFQGLTYAECATRHPAAYARHKARDPRFAPEGGESLLELAARLAATCAAIVRRHAGETVAVFTHGGVLDLLHRQATDKPIDAPRDFVIPHCALNWFEVTNGCWSILAWAERDHLEAARDEL